MGSYLKNKKRIFFFVVVVVLLSFVSRPRLSRSFQIGSQSQQKLLQRLTFFSSEQWRPSDFASWRLSEQHETLFPPYHQFSSSPLGPPARRVAPLGASGAMSPLPLSSLAVAAKSPVSAASRTLTTHTHARARFTQNPNKKRNGHRVGSRVTPARAEQRRGEREEEHPGRPDAWQELDDHEVIVCAARDAARVGNESVPNGDRCADT